MQNKHIIKGNLHLPKNTQRNEQLCQQLAEFLEWVHRAKDQNEVQKDKQKSVPKEQVPMLF
ncbi:hypothetical protein MT996_05385 [Ornithobacterium rhinotracheale]|uniref:hypothetical protein n=1 Tax=Ornithobacterium rhinotracheale TaxID=28251 RepID=UPI00129CF1ED|nr:hypothetical protein [Ornithobacterium rhinotracheale]UOH78902.1 hypothetical protein MT996_05385 [Ornithobacterium rhinotracheale]